MSNEKKPETILIVDDQPDNLRVLLTFLKKQGFDILVAQDGNDSLKITDYAHPDLILLDVMMPGGLSGFEVCKRIKSQETTQDIPVIFMTALTETVNKVKGFELGAADYITKPFQQEELLARVEVNLKIRKLQLQLQTQNQLLKEEISRSQKLEEARQKINLLLEQTVKSPAKTQGSSELEHCQKEFKKRQKDFEAFAHTVTGDLKNSLTTIVRLSTVRDESRLKSLDPSVKTFQVIRQEGLKAVKTIDTLQLLAGVLSEQSVKFELNEMSDIVTFVIEERLADRIKQLRAKIQIAEIWPAVPGYRPWLEEIWINYINIGFKYGGKSPHLELGASPIPPDQVRFWVRNNGLSLLKEEQAKLFLPKTPDDQAGVEEEGLGLSVVQKMVEKMGGQVGVETTKGKGNLFYFTLPAYINS